MSSCKEKGYCLKLFHGDRVVAEFDDAFICTVPPEEIGMMVEEYMMRHEEEEHLEDYVHGSFSRR